MTEYFVEIPEKPDPCLSADEIRKITGFSHAKRQLEVLKKEGYAAFMRPDNTVSLGRVQYENGPIRQESKIDAPQLRPLADRNGQTKKAERRPTGAGSPQAR